MDKKRIRKTRLPNPASQTRPRLVDGQVSSCRVPHNRRTNRQENNRKHRKNVGFPQYNSLADIAALKIVKSSTGRPLDHHDFIDIASENYELTPMDIKNMVRCAMLINKLSEGEIWRKLEAMRLNTGGSLSFTLDRFEKIKEGQIRPTQEDIRIIRELVDPNGEAFDEMEWLQSANLL